MSESPQDICKELLYAAMREPIGILVQTSDFARARQALYRARTETGDPALSVLQFRTSPGLAGGNLIIVKETVNIAEQAEAPLVAEPTNETLDDL